MDLIETEVKAPRNGIVSPVVASRSVVLRTARWAPAITPGTEPRGTVLICTGRSEFIEKYYETIEDLRDRGFFVVIFDWRGQGLSDRQLRNRNKGHIWTFMDFERDLEAVHRQILEPFCPEPWFGLAHSMGGPIVLSFAARHSDVFRRIVLSAPMIDIAKVPMPNMSRVLARWVCRLGFGRHLVPVGRNRALFLSTFDGNVLTSDRRRFGRTVALLQAEPRLAIGPPTFGWLNAAFDCIASLDQERFGRDFMTPTLAIMPGADVVVDRKAAERLTSRLRTGTLVSVVGAQHELLMERDMFRQQFWAAFDAFIPGSNVAERLAPAMPSKERITAPASSDGTDTLSPLLPTGHIGNAHARSNSPP